MPTRPIARLTPFILALACWSCAVGAARAQPIGKTVVVPYFAGEAEDAVLDLAKKADIALRAKRASLISLHDARDRFTARSREPQAASRSDIDALAKEAHIAIEHVAFGRTAAAQRSVRQIIELAERSLETLNRETATARTLLDACLSLVRASLHDNKRDDAIEQAMSCRRLVPDLAPSEVSHPAIVIGALAEADDQLRRMRVGRLNVQVRPARACEVYLNGRHLGHTPFFLDRAPIGEYRVQVECSAHPGRVHIVQLGNEPAQLTVDSEFDERLRTDPRLALRFPTSELAHGSLVTHATLAGREIRAEDVVLVGVLDSQAVLLRVQVPHERLVAGATLPLNATGAAFSQAIEQLDQARFAGVSPEDFRAREMSASPTAIAAAPAASIPGQLPRAQHLEQPMAPEPTARRERTSRQVKREVNRSMLRAGAATFALGAASETWAWYAYNVRVTRAESLINSLPNEYEEARQDWMAPRSQLLGASMTGAALATTGVELMMFAAPDEHLPWWTAGTAAGIGVGLASWGVADIVQGECSNADAPACAINAQQRERGMLLLLTSAPLLAVPITKLARGATRKGDNAEIRVASMASGLVVSGRW